MSWTHKDRQLLTGEYGFTPSGAHTQVADLSSAVTLAKPAGATQLMLQPLTNNIRYRLDGVAPDASTGFQLEAGTLLVIPVPGADVRVIEETASASLEYQWLG